MNNDEEQYEFVKDFWAIKGGQGKVYKVRDTRTGTLYALKIVKSI